MIQIRQNVFETNSSSTHSIVVSKGNPIPGTPDIYGASYATYENGILRLSEDNNFGWGWEVLSEWLDKFAYAVAEFQYNENDLEVMLEKVQEHLDCIHIIIPRRTLWNDQSKTEPDYGYVDHQSQGTLLNFLNETGISIIDFIFDDRYAVVLDNDNNYGDRYSDFIAKLDGEDYPADRWW